MRWLEGEALRFAACVRRSMVHRNVSFVIDQHPMEAWLSLHAAALQQAASERQLWERLMASLPTPRPTAHDMQQHPGERGRTHSLSLSFPLFPFGSPQSATCGSCSFRPRHRLASLSPLGLEGSPGVEMSSL